MGMVKTADGSIADTRTDKHSLALSVIKDECNRRDGKWHSATFELSTSKLYHLPITDINQTHQANQPKIRTKDHDRAWTNLLFLKSKTQNEKIIYARNAYQKGITDKVTLFHRNHF